MTERFEESRPRLRAVAYRMLGSYAEAEDAVQDAWLRLDRSDASAVENLNGWLTTVVARICLDRLRSRAARREEAADTVSAAAAGTVGAPDLGAGVDPEQQAMMADSIGAALLVVLELLAPAERVAFVLHDVFGVPFDDIGPIVDRSPDAARQLASRARRRVQGSAATADVDLVQQRKVVDAFYAAAREGNFEALVSLLHPDVALRPDAAAIRMGSLRPRQGAREVASVLAGGGARGARVAILDGVAGLVWMPGGAIRGAVQFTVADGRVVALDVTGDPERLQSLDIVAVDG